MITDICGFGYSQFKPGRSTEAMNQLLRYHRWANMLVKRNIKKELIPLKYIEEAKEFYVVALEK